MKNGGSFMKRWLSRSSNASNPASYGGSDTESTSTNPFSPPPLTDSSSTSASSSEIHTPKASPVHFSRKHGPSRVGAAKTPHTPPTRYSELPPAPSHRKTALSLPANSQRPTALVPTHPKLKQPNALVIAQPSVKLHHLLSYYPMHRPLIYDFSSPPEYLKQSPPQIISRRYPGPSAYIFAPQPTPVSDKDLSQHATTPPVTRMRIVSEIIPWSIQVRGRRDVFGDPESYVKVADVIHAIYDSLHSCVTQREWDRTSEEYRKLVKKAYFQRCVRAREYTLEGYEEKQGVRRVDWFLDRTMFLGLTLVSAEREGDGTRSRSSGGSGESTWAMMVHERR